MNNTKSEIKNFSSDVVYNALPDRIKKDLKDNEYTIAFFCCADDSESAMISTAFPRSRIERVDCTESMEEYDIVFSSNLHTHKEFPSIIDKVVESAKKYAILLIPLKDVSGREEHGQALNINSIAEEVGNEHILSFFEVIDCRDIESINHVLLVYQKKTDDAHLHVSEVYDNQLNTLIESNYLYRHSKLASDISEKELIKFTKKESRNVRKVFEEIIEINRELQPILAKTNTSIAFKLAHFFVELKHILTGNKEERKSGLKWLAGDRGLLTEYNYLGKIGRLSTRLESLLQDEISAVELEEAIINYYDMKKVLEFIVNSHSRTVFVHPSLIDWNVPLFQRPQQVFMSLGKQGFPVIYFTWNIYDKTDEPYVASDNVLLLKATNMVDVRRKIGWISRLVDALNIEMIVDIYSTGNMYDLSILEHIDSKNYRILYEYVDEISTEISGMEIPKSHMEMHEAFLGDESVYVVATAEKLYEDVLSIRKSDTNAICSGNGVDINHFRIEPDENHIPKNLKSIIDGSEPIIGYFGALAKWFDFELIKKAAELRPEYLYVLIGPLYGSLEEEVIDSLKKYENIIVTGAIDYKELPNIANYFTVATIPFLINEITESTSPIKLFEYMSMGKPVVTTPMRECKKINEVMIAENADEYVECLDKAVQIMKGPERNEYEKKMLQLASNHSWERKAEEIIELLGI